MKQKLALSCMLVHAPEVIVLDEPTFGVDPVSRNEFWTILGSLSREGTTILVSTAYMDEATLCDRVALIYKGEILASDVPSALSQGFTESLYLAETESPHRVYEDLRATSLFGQCHLFGDGVHFTLAPNVGSADVETVLRNRNRDLKAVRRIQPSLEDLFLWRMKE